MDRVEIKLTSGEARFLNAWLILSSVGGIAAAVAGNATGSWYPAIAFVALLLITFLGFNIRVARSRHLSVRSVLARGLPDRARRLSRQP